MKPVGFWKKLSRIIESILSEAFVTKMQNVLSYPYGVVCEVNVNQSVSYFLHFSVLYVKKYQNQVWKSHCSLELSSSDAEMLFIDLNIQTWMVSSVFSYVQKLWLKQIHHAHYILEESRFIDKNNPIKFITADKICRRELLDNLCLCEMRPV